MITKTNNFTKTISFLQKSYSLQTISNNQYLLLRKNLFELRTLQKEIKKLHSNNEISKLWISEFVKIYNDDIYGKK